MRTVLTIPILVVGATSAFAQLTVTVSPAKIAGQKAVVPLALKNNLAARAESARAVVFLLDEHGRMVAQGTRWIIGGEPGKPGLAAGSTNAFHFVLASDRPFASTNLTAKVTVSRVVLEGGKLADASREVSIVEAGK